MTAENHAYYRALLHLQQTMEPYAARQLVDACQDAGRAAAWNSPEAQVLVQDAQRWRDIRNVLLETMRDPDVWIDGLDETQVLAHHVRTLAAKAGVIDPAGPVDADVVRLAERLCGGHQGRVHSRHRWTRNGTEYFCPGGDPDATHQIPIIDIPDQRPGPDGD